MKKLMVLNILWFIIWLSCNSLTEPVRPKFSTQIDSVHVNSINGTIVDFTVYATFLNGCTHYSNYDVNQQGNDIYITLYHYVEEGPCPQVLRHITVNVKLDVRKNGLYHFHFGPKDKPTVNLELEIPAG